MSVIDFLETLGREPPVDAAAYRAAVDALDADDRTRAALLARDGAALARLLDGRAAMWCLIATPDDEPQDAPGEPDRDDDDKEAPAREA